MSIKKRLLAAVAAITMLASSVVALAATPTMKTELLTADELAMFGGLATTGVKISMENMAGTMDGLQVKVRIPTNVKVAVNKGTAFMPNYQYETITKDNLAAGIQAPFAFAQIVANTDTSDAYDEYTLMAANVNINATDSIMLWFGGTAADYVLPEDAFTISVAYVNYTGASSQTACDIVNYNDGTASNPEIKPDNGTEDANDAKTWNITVDGGYVADGGKLIATLTNNAVATEKTQTVELTLGNKIDGDAAWSFNLKVRFKNPEYRDNTILAIEKAAN